MFDDFNRVNVACCQLQKRCNCKKDYADLQHCSGRLAVQAFSYIIPAIPAAITAPVIHEAITV